MRTSCRIAAVLVAAAVATSACSDHTVTVPGPGSAPSLQGVEAPPPVNRGMVQTQDGPLEAPGPLLAAPEGEPSLLSTGGTVVIDFDGYPDNAQIGATYGSLGITFTSGQFLHQGGDLNSAMYPPRSGAGVAYNLTGPSVSFEFSRAASYVAGYVTSLYGITLVCRRADGSVVGSASAPYPNLANYSASVAAPNYLVEVRGSGITRCSFDSTPNYFTVDDLTFTPDSPLEIVEVTTQLPDSSFTTADGENRIQLRAEVGDPSLAGRVKWQVVDDPSDGVSSPQVSAADGLSTSFTVGQPANPRNRWPADHPGALGDKALSYVARAYYVTDAGDTIWSAPVTIRQHEKDVLRQEYLDFRKATVPDREGLGQHSTTHFSAAELNFGDYTVFPAMPRLRTGIEAFRTLVGDYLTGAGYTFNGLTVTSSFRNPVHHHVHENLRTVESQHLYGNALDVRIWNLGPSREVVFEEMKSIAKDPSVDACYEPEHVVRAASRTRELSHFHIDFRATCPAGW
jgi:hypothetical protein